MCFLWKFWLFLENLRLHRCQNQNFKKRQGEITSENDFWIFQIHSQRTLRLINISRWIQHQKTFKPFQTIWSKLWVLSPRIETKLKSFCSNTKETKVFHYCSSIYWVQIVMILKCNVSSWLLPSTSKISSKEIGK